MTLKDQRIQQVYSFFKYNDIELGYRKLMDCAIDTQDLSIYQKIIALTDWKTKHPTNIEDFTTKCLSILNAIESVPIESNNDQSAVIEAKNITKSYGANSFFLGPVDVTIKKGQIYGLVGENGNGKTTLLRILAKEINYNTGTISYHFNKNYTSDYDLRSKLVYIPQRTEKWYGSLKDNLKLVLTHYGIPKEENEIRVLMMIARMGLWNYKHLKWSELSSGYKMRFELARTLLRQPEVLLLDEPLANLDVLAQQVILEDLKSICNSITNPIALILSSQQLFEVEKISDNVIFLKNGQYKDTQSNSSNTEEELIIELDSTATKEELFEVLNPLMLKKLVYNGGTYIAYFEKTTPFNQVLKQLGETKTPVIYIRNISISTRRFFV
jgi:ABC-2 type transport system ATP-binding protein